MSRKETIWKKTKTFFIMILAFLPFLISANTLTYPDGFCLPFRGEYRITNGRGGAPLHNGASAEAYDFQDTDITNFEVFAASSGVAHLWPGTVQNHHNQGFGNVILIDHGDNLWSFYAHLDSFVVGEGEVSIGEHIAFAGDTGTTSLHLHFEIRRGMRDSNGQLSISNGTPVRIDDHPQLDEIDYSYPAGDWRRGRADSAIDNCIGSQIESATLLLFDSSGSMEEADRSGLSKIQASQSSVQNVLNIISTQNVASNSASHQIAVVSFSESAEIRSSLDQSLNQAEAAISSLIADGGTAMPDGLRLAIDAIELSNSGTKIVILLSDGIPNIGLGGDAGLFGNGVEDLARDQSLEIAQEAGNKGICIYTIGLGYTNDFSSLNEDFLRQLAENSGCGSYSAPDDANQLANIYVDLRHTSSGGKQSFIHDGHINQGETVDFGTIEVLRNWNELLFNVLWGGSSVSPIITDPRGTIVDENYPGATISFSETLATVLIEDPVHGNWNWAIYGEEAGPNGTPYHAILSSFEGPAATIPASSGGSFAIILVVLVVVAMSVYIQVNKSKKKTARVIALQFQTGPLQGQRLSVPQATAIIGRGSQAAIPINDSSVSRQHAQIYEDSKGWIIQDLESQTGTFVNGRRMTRVRIGPGDQIKLGNSTFTIISN